jgi:hypothetical protein
VNPGQLKLELVHHGVMLDASVREDVGILHTGGAAPGRVAASEAAVELALPGELVARVPVHDDTSGAGYVLSVRDGDLIVRRTASGESGHYDVRLNPPPRFYRRRTTRGTPMSAVAAVHGSHILVSPNTPCALSSGSVPCSTCAGQRDHATTPPSSVEDVVEVIRAAFEEGAAEFVYFAAPFSDTDDRGLAFLEPYIKATKRHFDTLVAAHLHPPVANSWIDHAYAIGIDALSFGVDIFDPDLLEERCPGRIRHIGRDRYYAALEHAAAVFPNGAVWSDLVIGLEPEESTRKGIDALAGIGVVPVLGVPPVDLQPAAQPDPTALAAPLGAHLYTVVKERGINMGWLRDLSSSITPLEARFFVGDEAWLAVTVQNFYRSRVGALAARNLARFRRRLRVRAVSDSFDASGL